MKYICRINDLEFEYVANTERLDSNFNADEAMDAVRNADLVVAQPIFNMDNPLNHHAVSENAKEVIFFPYIFMDGIFSLSAAEVGSSTIYGSDAVTRYLGGDVHAAIVDFISGNINFNNEQRFDTSINELIRRENYVNAIRISDVILEQYRKRPLFITHNHPEKILMDVMCARLFQHAGWKYRTYANSSHLQRADYMFETGETVFSPYDAERLSIEYPSDDQWWTIGRRLLNRIWDGRTQGSGLHGIGTG